MIETARLRLRPARPADLEPLHDVLSDPRAMRYWSRPAHDDIALTLDFLRGMMAEGELDLIVEHEGRCIGKAGVWRAPDFGYILHPRHWGRGLAYEALAALLPEIARRRPNLTELTAEVDPRNAASMRLLEKLGFTHKGTEPRNFLFGGWEWCDTAYFSRPMPGDCSPESSLA